jgi:hypothetical protein
MEVMAPASAQDKLVKDAYAEDNRTSLWRDWAAEVELNTAIATEDEAIAVRPFGQDLGGYKQ